MRRHEDQSAVRRNDHERPLDEIRDIKDDFTDEASTASALAGRLEAWFSRHFETHDAGLTRALGALTCTYLSEPSLAASRTASSKSK